MVESTVKFHSTGRTLSINAEAATIIRPLIDKIIDKTPGFKAVTSEKTGELFWLPPDHDEE